MAEIYIDLDIVAEINNEDAYLVVFPKSDFNRLVSFSPDLSIRTWDGEKPVILETYGENAIRTNEDGSTDNNLVNLPDVSMDQVKSILG